MLMEEFGLITDQEVGEVVQSAELLEEYPDDRLYPSCLFFGLTGVGRPLHLVVAYNETGDEVVIVTVYQPDPAEWEDYRRRRQ